MPETELPATPTPATDGHVGIVTDSSCDLPDEVAHAAGIEIVPLSIRFGDDELIDREELSTAEFWARCAASPELPSTAAPSPGRFEQSYRALAARGSTHIVAVDAVRRAVGDAAERRAGGPLGRARRHHRARRSTAAP